LHIGERVPHPLEHQRDYPSVRDNITAVVHGLEQYCSTETRWSATVIASRVNALEKRIPEEIPYHVSLGPHRTKNNGLLPRRIQHPIVRLAILFEERNPDSDFFVPGVRYCERRILKVREVRRV
jgi:hypothetical protein